MQDIFKWIDSHRDELVAELQTLLRQPSISAQKIGLDECAALLRSQWVTDGLPNTQILPVTGAPSIVYATEPATQPGAKTLLCYSHYDVQPPEPLELWVDPPFSAAIRDGVIYARGATSPHSIRRRWRRPSRGCPRSCRATHRRNLRSSTPCPRAGRQCVVFPICNRHGAHHGFLCLCQQDLVTGQDKLE